MIDPLRVADPSGAAARSGLVRLKERPSLRRSAAWRTIRSIRSMLVDRGFWRPGQQAERDAAERDERDQAFDADGANQLEARRDHHRIRRGRLQRRLGGFLRPRRPLLQDVEPNQKEDRDDEEKAGAGKARPEQAVAVE